MPSTVFYLKYRPQSLDDLIGQDSVKKVLSSHFEEDKLSHAYLFVGPRGTGKTSTARILAKMVNCSSEKNLIPCNKCDVCLSITDGSNLDLIEIDAASNRGIEDIRSLKETIKLSPTGKGKKVYIIDEVHMLTPEAFNALLKTLEEPPAHALFILATTDAGKIPTTIMSRVQRLDFSLATVVTLREALEKIVKSEKIDIESEALDLIIKRADGSFRDGIKLLDQFGSLEKKITIKDLLATLKTSRFEDLTELLKDLSANKAGGSLLKVTNLLKDGAEVKETILSMMDLMRDLVFIQNDLGQELVEHKYTLDKYELLKELANQFTCVNLVKNLNILQEALTKLKFASILSLPLELAVIEICEKQTVDNGKIEKKEVNIPTSTLKEPSSIIDHLSSSDDILKLKEKWNFVLETIRQNNFSLEALLRAVNLSECNGNSVIIEVPYSFHQRILEAPKNRDLLESVLSDILGRNMKIMTVLGDRPVRREDIANIDVAADDEIIRAAAEIFNAES